MSRENCITAESYYQASLKAIEDTFQTAVDETSDPLEEALFRETQASLMAALQQVAQPMKDSEYLSLINAYHETPDDEYDGDYEDETSQDCDDATIDGDDGDEELDEGDLLDVRALKEAKQKRQQVRALSSRVTRVRQRVLDRVAKTTEKECQITEPEIQIEKSPDLDGDQHSASMQASLQNLNNILKDSTWQENLPKQVERIQTTLKSIQDRKKTNQQLSQTESAILSQTNDRFDAELENERLRLSQTSVADSNPVVLDGANVSPQDRLATFMQDYF